MTYSESLAKGSGSSVPPEHIEIQMHRILSHSTFRHAPRLRRFLELIVEHAVAGQAAPKEYVIGVRVFDRGESYDPQTDPIVRIMAGRLRSKLAEYYAQNADEAVILEVPLGGYGLRCRPGKLRGSTALGSPGTGTRRIVVGRHAEKEILRFTLAEVVQTQNAQALLIHGDPGIGKTTLCEDFLADLKAKGASLWVARGNCLEQSSDTDPFAPILEVLDSFRRWPKGERAESALSRVAPLWFACLSRGSNHPTPPQTRGASAEWMRRELRHFFEELTRDAPAVIVLDDLQWADTSTCELLRSLRVRLAELPVLFIACSRPESIAASAEPFLTLRAEWSSKSFLDEIELGSLAAAETAELIRARFPGNQFSPDFVEAIQKRTQGHPLFITDMLKYLEQTGLIASKSNVFSLTKSVADLNTVVPSSTREAIRLNLKRLSQSDYTILSFASIQGMDFDSAVLAHAMGLDASVIEERLQHLHESRVVVVGRTEQLPRGLTIRAQFVHQFYFNVLYSDLPPSRRAHMSLAVARAWVAVYGENAGANASRIAHLFEAADDSEGASAFYLKAALASARVFAYPEVLRLCERGLRAVHSLPRSEELRERELTLLVVLGVAQMCTLGYGAAEVYETHERARELCLQLGRRELLVRSLWRLHTCRVNRGELVEALSLAEEMRTLADEVGTLHAKVESLHALGTTLGFMGRLAEAREPLERIKTLTRTEQNAFDSSLYVLDPLVTSLSLFGRLRTLMGEFDEGLEDAIRSHARAQELTHPTSVIYAKFWIAWIHHMRGEYEEARRHAEEVTGMAATQGFPYFIAWGRIVLGAAMSQLGDLATGIDQMQKSLEHQAALGLRIERTYCLTLFADALVRDGQLDYAESCLEEATHLAEHTEARSFEAETCRLRGELFHALGKGQTAQAMSEFNRGWEIARRAHCRALELRAAISACHYARSEEEIESCRRMLATTVKDLESQSSAPLLKSARRMLSSV